MYWVGLHSERAIYRGGLSTGVWLYCFNSAKETGQYLGGGYKPGGL